MTDTTSFLQATSPFRAFLARFWSGFFRGDRTPEWLKLSDDAAKIAAVLDAQKDLPENTKIDNPFDGISPLDIERVFAKLFYGVSEENLPLTMSAWTTPAGLTVSKASERAAAVYRAHGLTTHAPAGESEEFPASDNLPDDHLGILLAFLALLAEKNETTKEQMFLDEFLLAWWPILAEKIASRPESEPLRPAFDAFGRYLKAERALLEHCR